MDPKPFRDMTEPELAAVMRRAAAHVADQLPDDSLFVLLAFDPPASGTASGGVAQYISNAERSGIVATLRETADRLEAREQVERVPFIPSYTCPRCRAVSYHPDDARHRYCAQCQRFNGTDEV